MLHHIEMDFLISDNPKNFPTIEKFPNIHLAENTLFIYLRLFINKYIYDLKRKFCQTLQTIGTRLTSLSETYNELILGKINQTLMIYSQYNPSYILLAEQNPIYKIFFTGSGAKENHGIIYSLDPNINQKVYRETPIIRDNCANIVSILNSMTEEELLTYLTSINKIAVNFISKQYMDSDPLSIQLINNMPDIRKEIHLEWL